MENINMLNAHYDAIWASMGSGTLVFFTIMGMYTIRVCKNDGRWVD